MSSTRSVSPGSPDRGPRREDRSMRQLVGFRLDDCEIAAASLRDPAARERGAHAPRADQDNRVHAVPRHSSSAAAIASSAVFPPQSTNWKAG